MEEENQLQLPVKELVRSDLNLEKWEIFAPRKHTRERTIKRITPQGSQQVEIGLTVRGGKSYTLTAGDGKVWYALLKKWEQAGKPVDRTVQFTIRSLCKEIWSKTGSSESRQMKESLLNLQGVSIRFVECYETPDFSDKITKAFSLLSNVNIFERRKKTNGTIEKYFGFSEFKINETIMDTILKRKMKPIRLDVVCTLKSDCAFILYRYLDLILFENLKHEKDLLEVAEICDLKKEQPLYDIKRTIAHALKELQGKEITTGRIASAEILESQTPSGWKISVIKGKQAPALPASAVSPEAGADDSKRLQDYFESLPAEEQARIRKQAEEEAKANPYFEIFKSEETKQEFIAGTIQNIVKEKIAQDKIPAPPLYAEKGQETAERRATRKQERKAESGKRDRRGAGGKPAYAPVPEPLEDRRVVVKITYQNPTAGTVKIAGDWNGWQGENMGWDGSGVWEKELKLLPGTYKYKLVVDGVWMTNPDGEKAGDEMGNNLLKVSGRA